jgi:hypothetical protein
LRVFQYHNYFFINNFNNLLAYCVSLKRTIPLFADVQISLEKADSGIFLPESGTFNVTRVRRGTLIPVLFVGLSVGRASAARATRPTLAPDRRCAALCQAD